MECKNITPEGYKWEEGLGLMKQFKTKDVKLCNAYPEVLSKKKIINYKRGTERSEIEVKFHFENGEEKTYCYSMQEITSGAYMNKLQGNLLIEMGKKNTVKEVFQYMIQKQIKGMEIIKVPEYEWGWNQCRFVFEKDVGEMLSEDGYLYAVGIARQIILSGGIVVGCLLAALHGPLKRLLVQAGIQHDFTTCISGKSGVGKTALVKKYCCYLQETNVIFSLTSDRKELKRKICYMSDITIVADDFSNSDSDRMLSRQVQILAEIIQASSDSGQVLVDGRDGQSSGTVHIVTTVEKVLKNISTMNRCYLVEMEEPLPKECWNELETFERTKGMWHFMFHILSYVSQKYSELLKRIPKDYKYYLENTDWTTCNVEQSKNRIINTYAVQSVLLKILIDYFRDLRLDTRLLGEVDKIGRRAVHNGCQMVIDSIEETIKKAKHMQILPALADILFDAIQSDEYTTSEKKYYKEPDDYAFVILSNGYFSFRGSKMCERIAEVLGKESVTSKALSNELKHYSLVKTDGKGNCSITSWNCEKRMYHVRVRELMELVYPHEGNYGLSIPDEVLNPYEEY